MVFPSHFARWLRLPLLLTLVFALPVARVCAEEAIDLEHVRRLFENPPDDARIMMRWWWFGPAVTKPEIARELRAMKDAGIGGVELQSVYPLALDDADAGIKNLPFLSDEHLDALRFANHEARDLGLRVDLTLGSGWPFGGPSVSTDRAAGRLRVERVKLRDGEDQVQAPALGAGEKLLTVFLACVNGESVSPNGTRELSTTTNGTIVLPLDRAGANEVWFFVSSRTKQQVKRAAVGAEGFVLDHYDRAAVSAYLDAVGDRLLTAFGDAPPYAVFCDSLEVYLSDWTPDLLSEFQRRRGYDLQPYLPALVADFGPRTAEIRRDWGETLTELMEERFVQPVQAWAARHHTRFRFQAYGVPPARISTNRLVDLPEGEGSQWKRLSAVRWASSASHLYGKPVTSSETWTWLHSPAFRATPLDLKAEADLHFLSGSNQLVGHGWPYSPPGVGYPGWRFYAAGALNDQNPWWLVMPDLTRYLQRVSFLLRQGQPANDLALYLPTDDAWAQFRDKHDVNLFTTLQKHLGKDLVATLTESGYNFDCFDDAALRAVGKVESGALALGQNRYRAVILPDVERMPLPTLRTLVDFVRGGGIVIATDRLPETVTASPANSEAQTEMKEAVQRLFTDAGTPAHFVTDEAAKLAALLPSLVHPDVAFSGNRTDLGFIHRHADDAEIYFIANTGPVRRDAKASFRVRGMTAEEWNPLTGATRAMAAINRNDDATLNISLEPYESRFIVFSPHPIPDHHETIGRVVDVPNPLDLSDGWQVSFDHGKTVTTQALRSWTADNDTRYFSGCATYQRNVTLPKDYPRPGCSALLDFGPGTPVPVEALPNGTRAWIDGPVREAALVYLNGERVGAVWHPPYQLDVSRVLRPGINALKIVVGNTAINSLAGTALPDYKPLTQVYGERFKAQDMDKLEPLPSGLNGPVRIVFAVGEASR